MATFPNWLWVDIVVVGQYRHGITHGARGGKEDARLHVRGSWPGGGWNLRLCRVLFAPVICSALENVGPKSSRRFFAGEGGYKEPACRFGVKSSARICDWVKRYLKGGEDAFVQHASW